MFGEKRKRGIGHVDQCDHANEEDNFNYQSLPPIYPRGPRQGMWLNATPNWSERVGSGIHRTLVKRLGRAVLTSDQNLSHSNELLTDWDRVFESPPTCNNFTTLVAGADDKLVWSGLSCLFNLSYASMLHEKLYNQIVLKAINPAALVCDSTTASPESVSTLVTPYQCVERVAAFFLPPKVTQEIKRLSQKIKQFDTYGSEGRPELIDEIAQRNAHQILSELEELTAHHAAAIKASLDRGVTRQALVTVIESAIPSSLCHVMEGLGDNVSSRLTSGHDLNVWKRDELTRNQMVEEFVSAYCRELYGFNKYPHFLATCIERAELNLRNGICQSKVDENTVIVANGASGKEGSSSYLAGVIMVSERMKRQLCRSDLVMSGKRVTRKPIYHLPNTGFVKAAGDHVRAVTIRDGVGMAIKNKNGEHVVDLLTEKHTSGKKTEALLEMSELGESMFGPSKRNSGDEDSSDGGSNRASENILYHVTHTSECLYVMGEHGPYIIECNQEDSPQYREGKATSMSWSPSLVQQKQELMRVTVGDVNDSNDYLHGWVSALLDNRLDSFKTTIPNNKLFLVPDVIMHSPSIESKHYIFGPVELSMAFANPYLYNATEHAAIMNENLAIVNGKSASTLQRQLALRYAMELGDGLKKEELFLNYSKHSHMSTPCSGKGRECLDQLLSLEKSPFIDFASEQANQITRYRARRRNYFGEIPSYVLSYEQAKLRGACLLSNATSEDQLRAMNQSILTAMQTEIPTTDDQDMEWAIDIGKTMNELQNKLYGGIAGVAGLPSPKAIASYAVIPCVFDMKVSYRDANVCKVETERPDGHNYMKGSWSKEQADKLTDLPNHIMQGQVKKIAMDRSIPILHRIATVCQYFVLLTPLAITTSIKHRVPIGLAVDFLRLQTLNSDTVVVGKPFSHDMIITGGETDIKMQADGRLKVSVGCKIQTTNNMIAGGAVSASFATPMPKPTSLACGSKNEPLISMDYVSRSRQGTLTSLSSDQVINETLAQSEARRKHVIGRASGLCSDEDEFVAVIRPVANPTHTHLPFLGKPIYTGITSTNVDSQLVKFTDPSAPTRNPYMSGLDSIYQLLHCPTNTNVGSTDDPIRRKTFCQSTINPVPVSITTQVLESTLEMDWTLEKRLFSPTESGAFTNYCAAKSQLRSMKLSSVPTNGASDSASGLMGVATRNGFSIPYTHWSSRRIREEAERLRTLRTHGQTIRGKLPSEHLILSPFSVPQELTESTISL